MRRRHTASGPDAVRITTASRPRSEDIRGRERRYLISMGVRTVCFVLAVIFIGHWVMWVFIAASVFLPYVAVVLANSGANPDPEPADFGYQPDLRALQERPAPPEEPKSA